MLKEGLKNWKLRLVLSALLCIFGLAAMISMIMGIFVSLSVYDKTVVALAVTMVGIPAYLIVSGLGKIDEQTIARFLNENVDEIDADILLLAQDKRRLNEEELILRQQIEQFFEKSPVYNHLPDKPVRQAYYLMVLSILISLVIWYFT